MPSPSYPQKKSAKARFSCVCFLLFLVSLVVVAAIALSLSWAGRRHPADRPRGGRATPGLATQGKNDYRNFGLNRPLAGACWRSPPFPKNGHLVSNCLFLGHRPQPLISHRDTFYQPGTECTVRCRAGYALSSPGRGGTEEAPAGEAVKFTCEAGGKWTSSIEKKYRLASLNAVMRRYSEEEEEEALECVRIGGPQKRASSALRTVEWLVNRQRQRFPELEYFNN